MKHGNKIIIFFILLFFGIGDFILAEEKITTSPLINIDNIKPSFENLDERK